MVIGKLQGGLGNQMFQYAAAKNISGGKALYFDTSFINNNYQSTDIFTAREFRLSLFKNIKIKKINPFTTRILLNNKLLYRILKKMFFPAFTVVHDGDMIDPLKYKTIYVDGYFQNETYFKAVSAQLIHDFAFPQLNSNAGEWAKKITGSTNAVSIHIRRGDYLKPTMAAYHGVLPLAYYQQAVAFINAEINNAQYFIFSDDQDWCKQNLNLGINAFFVNNNPDWADMALMSKCSHHIIANSSFSWWAAWLNPSADKVVIAPKNWFTDTQANNNIIPQNWITI